MLTVVGDTRLEGDLAPEAVEARREEQGIGVRPERGKHLRADSNDFGDHPAIIFDKADSSKTRSCKRLGGRPRIKDSAKPWNGFDFGLGLLQNRVATDFRFLPRKHTLSAPTWRK